MLFIASDFDGDGAADNIRFAIKKLKVWTDPTSEGYPFTANMDVQFFLEVKYNITIIHLSNCFFF